MTVLTEDLTYQLGNTGVTLNTDDNPLAFIDITKVRGLDSAPYRTTFSQRESDDGGFVDAEFENGRDVILQGTVYTTVDYFEQYMDLLKFNWAPGDDLIPFYYKHPGVSERFLYVKSLGISYDSDEGRRRGVADIQFSCFAEDPRIYEGDLITANMQLGGTVFAGFGFPLGFSFGFGGVTNSNDQQSIFVLAGNRPTPPTFIIHGPVQDPRIYNDSKGKLMWFSPITLATGETLVVDTKNKTVKFNGVTNRRDVLVTPDWFYLEPGENVLRYRALSSDPTTYLEVQYRPAYR